MKIYETHPIKRRKKKSWFLSDIDEEWALNIWVQFWMQVWSCQDFVSGLSNTSNSFVFVSIYLWMNERIEQAIRGEIGRDGVQTRFFSCLIITRERSKPKVLLQSVNGGRLMFTSSTWRIRWNMKEDAWTRKNEGKVNLQMT